MRRTLRSIVVVAALAGAGGCATANPEVQIGVGLAQPVAHLDVATAATVDSRGTVQETQTLDDTPQLFVEVHRTFPLGAYHVGPMIGAVIPRIRIGASTEDPSHKDEGFAVGFGGVSSFKLGSEGERRIHVGILWEVVSLDHIADAWKNGKEAPLDRAGTPLPPQIAQGFVNRGLVTVTVSGVFK